jgi:hypothetical protein
VRGQSAGKCSFPSRGCKLQQQGLDLLTVTEPQSQPFDASEHAYDENGVDLTLIRWMLSLTPLQRIEHIQQAADSLQELRSLNGIPEPR